jgi:hypothetical protein
MRRMRANPPGAECAASMPPRRQQCPTAGASDFEWLLWPAMCHWCANLTFAASRQPGMQQCPTVAASDSNIGPGIACHAYSVSESHLPASTQLGMQQCPAAGVHSYWCYWCHRTSSLDTRCTALVLLLFSTNPDMQQCPTAGVHSQCAWCYCRCMIFLVRMLPVVGTYPVTLTVTLILFHTVPP